MTGLGERRAAGHMIKRTLAALAATTMVVAGLAGCGSDEDTQGSGSASSSHNDADVTFVQSMIPHHEQAVRMAEMADDAASSPEVRDLAERIKDAQRPEIETMEGWLEDWGEDSDGGHGGMDHGDGHDDMDGMDDMPGMMSDGELGDLDETDGKAFDRMFLTMMIDHHEGAIEMAETQLTDGRDADVTALARDIRTAQTEEIAEMKQLLAR
jgi:uncharacterized protein (DUF305 family)